MAKFIKYKLLSEINRGTKENPNIEQVFIDKSIICETKAQFELNYPIAQKEAIGEITVTGDYEPERQTTDDRVKELEEALTLLLEGATE